MSMRTLVSMSTYQVKPVFTRRLYDQPGTDGPGSYGARLESTLNKVPANWKLIQIVSSGDVDWGIFEVSDEGVA
jgi:hypothetical protein